MPVSKKQLNPNLNLLFEWAQNEPELLNQWLQQEVQLILDNAPPAHRHRLEGLQFKIEMERRKAKHPMASCMAITRLMYDSIYELSNAFNCQGERLDPPSRDYTAVEAKVLPFKPRKLNNPEKENNNQE